IGRHEIADDAHDEQLARRLVEGQLRGDPRIGATEYGGERHLALRAGRAAGGEVALVHLAGDIAGIALDQARAASGVSTARAGWACAVATSGAAVNAATPAPSTSRRDIPAARHAVHMFHSKSFNRLHG